MRTTGRAPFDGRMPDTTGAEGSFALDAKTEALLHLAVLIALGASHPAYRQVVDDGRAAGAAVDDLVAVLTTVASHVGGADTVAAAPAIAEAIGYDLDACLGAPARHRPAAPTRPDDDLLPGHGDAHSFLRIDQVIVVVEPEVDAHHVDASGEPAGERRVVR